MVLHKSVRKGLVRTLMSVRNLVNMYFHNLRLHQKCDPTDHYYHPEWGAVADHYILNNNDNWQKFFKHKKMDQNISYDMRIKKAWKHIVLI